LRVSLRAPVEVQPRPEVAKLTGSSEHLLRTTSAYERTLQRSLRWRHLVWYWGDAILLDALASSPPGRALAAAEIRAWSQTAPDSFDDCLAPGATIVDLARSGDVDRVAVRRFLASVDRLPAMECGLPALEPHRLAFRFGFCIDALYHLPPALVAAGAWTDEPDRIDAATEMMFRGVELLKCPAGWAQWYDDTVQRNCAIAWSRGVGWALLGVLDLLGELDGAGAGRAQDIAHLQTIAGSMLDRLSATQETDGNWRAVLEDTLAPTETSTAAFYVAAALHPMTSRFWTAPPEILAAAETSVLASIDENGIATGVSADILPAWKINGYRSFECEPSPWGQGAALRALGAMAGQSRATD
jgi:hypothetical protein